jgi:hypothetical protein
VVDASVFPRIPGFFIACAVFMVSEKAADVILRAAKSRKRPPAVNAPRCFVRRSRLSQPGTCFPSPVQDRLVRVFMIERIDRSRSPECASKVHWHATCLAPTAADRKTTA